MGVGLPTAFVAKYKKGNGAPNLGVILEYDALRGTKGAFHGDQHSAQGPVGMAAAIAMAEYLTRTKTPGSGHRLRHAGRGDDAAQREDGDAQGARVRRRRHHRPQPRTDATSRPAPGFGTCCLNIVGAKYTFSGAPAHQMTAWNGRNALTAVIQLFDNIDAMRSNIRPEARIQGVIIEGGAAPNVVPDRTVADFYIRYPDEVYLAAGGRRSSTTRRGRGAGDRHQGEDRSLRPGSRRHRRGHARRGRRSRT